MGALTFAPSLVLAVGGPCQGSSSLAASHTCNHFLTELVRLGPRCIVALVPHQPWIRPWFGSNFCALDSIGRKRTALSRLQHTQRNNPPIRNVHRSRPFRDISWRCSALRTTSLVRCLPSADQHHSLGNPLERKDIGSGQLNPSTFLLFMSIPLQCFGFIE